MSEDLTTKMNQLEFDIHSSVEPVTDDTGEVIDVSTRVWFTVKGTGPDGPLFKAD